MAIGSRTARSSMNDLMTDYYPITVYVDDIMYFG